MSFEYHRPTSLVEAWRLAASPGARFVAGGTDVMVRVREGKLAPTALVSLGCIAELARIDAGPPLFLGASVKVAELEVSVEVAAAIPVLAQAAHRVGSVQIRNVATLGGNLCNASPCADLAPPLLVHEARVRLASSKGVREVPLGEFFVGPRVSLLEPGELLLGVVVPVGHGARTAFVKQGRVQMDIALASIAVSLEFSDGRCVRARIAGGSLGPTPMRLVSTERVLEGRALDDAAVADARSMVVREVRPISDVRASEEYRRHLAGALFVRAVRQAMSGGAA